MALSFCAVVLALTVSGVPASNDAATPPSPTPQPAVAQPIREAAASATPLERWQLDMPQARPAALPLMYATFGALQVADVYSTRRALGANAHEVNPVMQTVAGNVGAMLAVKALSTAGTIYFAERAWKKNRKGTVVLMALINGVTAAVTARNLRHAR